MPRRAVKGAAELSAVFAHFECRAELRCHRVALCELIRDEKDSALSTVSFESHGEQAK